MRVESDSNLEIVLRFLFNALFEGYRKESEDSEEEVWSVERRR